MSYINIPGQIARQIAVVATSTDLPSGVPEGSIRYVADTDTLYTYDGSAWHAGGGGGTGTVTSVGLSAPAEFTVSGSPVTTTGTLTFTKANQNANIVYAGPNTGAAAAPTFRSLVAADIPSISTGITGTLPVPNGGTGVATITANRLVKGNGTSAIATTGINIGSLDEISLYTAAFDDQVGTTYTVAAADKGMIITLTNASAITLTLPDSLPKGFTCLVAQMGAGQVTFTPSGGATRQNRLGFTKSAGQYAVCSLIVTSNAGSAAVWVLGGDVGA